VNGTTGVFNACAASTVATRANLAATTYLNPSTALGLGAISVQTIGANTFIYILSSIGNVYQCAVNSADGSLSGCIATQGGVQEYPTGSPGPWTNPTASWKPTAIAMGSFDGSTVYAYVADQLNNVIYVCNVSSDDGTLSACAAASTPGLVNPSGVLAF
jgi:hypothetical protein